MRIVMHFLSWLGLLLTIVPAFLVFQGSINWESHAGLMAIGMVLWFGSAPFWMKKTQS